MTPKFIFNDFGSLGSLVGYGAYGSLGSGEHSAIARAKADQAGRAYVEGIIVFDVAPCRRMRARWAI